MITAYRGRIRVTTDETEMKGDLACVSKCIYLELKLPTPFGVLNLEKSIL